MNISVGYSNRILTDQERIEFTVTADKTVQKFAESIDGMHNIMENLPQSEPPQFCQIMNILSSVSTFICYSYADCIVLTKYFLNTQIPYEKSFMRGKLKVQLNESFKKLYGFNEKAYKDSYCSKLQKIMDIFPGFKKDFENILSDLENISKQDSWWKDVRNAEVHIDIVKLYESRHEEINESKVVMETKRLIDFFLRFNDLMTRMIRAYITHIQKHLKTENINTM